MAEGHAENAVIENLLRGSTIPPTAPLSTNPVVAANQLGKLATSLNCLALTEGGEDAGLAAHVIEAHAEGYDWNKVMGVSNLDLVPSVPTAGEWATKQHLNCIQQSGALIRATAKAKAVDGEKGKLNS